jgi:hypothetical protein
MGRGCWRDHTFGRLRTHQGLPEEEWRKLRSLGHTENSSATTALRAAEMLTRKAPSKGIPKTIDFRIPLRYDRGPHTLRGSRWARRQSGE